MGTEGGNFGLTAQPPAQDDPGANGTQVQVHRWLHVGSLVVRLVPESQIKSTECYLGITNGGFLSSHYMATVRLWKMENMDRQDRGQRSTWLRRSS